MRVLLLHLDGRLPNIALMRVAAHHRSLGDDVVLRRADNPRFVEPNLGDPDEWDRVYASLIFERSRALGERVKAIYPGAIIGGTGWDITSSLEQHGVTTIEQDYSVYPRFESSIGFSQRGCRLRCSFCVVPKKEGAVRAEQTIQGLWRGEPWPREIVLLDNDFFGQTDWRARIDEMISGRFKVSLCQGINARMLTDETAAAIASIDYRSMDNFNKRLLYTAWDNRKDGERLMAGLHALIRHGVNPKHIMVYMLIGYWPGETHEDRDYRRAALREVGVLPYPMIYNPTPELRGFQRWVLRGYDKAISWPDWVKSKYQARPNYADVDMDTLL